MKRNFIALMALIVVCSCNNFSNKNSDDRVLPQSSGNINNILVVIENEDWQSTIGEAVRDVIASPFLGLPQDEPKFSLSQIPPKVFSGFAKTHRSVLKIEKGEPSIKIIKDLFARPQLAIVITGNKAQDIAALLRNNADKIVEAFKEEELAENQRRISKSLHKSEALDKELGIHIKFPTAYRIAKNENGFLWLRKDITTGHANLMVFDLPHSAFNKNSDSLVKQVIRIRDSVGEKYIPGPLEGTYLSTEMAYTPYIIETTLAGKPAIETKGIWEVSGAYMGGPFINYIIEDKPNNRWLVIEGFVFAPSVDKREHIFELEAIIKTITFNES